MERITEYFHLILDETKKIAWIISRDLNFREIDNTQGYNKGILYLHGGFTLHIAEYIAILSGKPKRYKYRYQLLDHKGSPIVRWDNAAHHPEVSTHPFHKHTRDGKIVSSKEMNINMVISELDDIAAEYISQEDRDSLN